MSALSGAAILVTCAATGCAATILRSGEIVDRYARAACIPGHAPEAQPFSQTWNDTITLRSGTRVHVVGKTGSDGQIVVEYDDGRDKVTFSGRGEKGGPSEVRFDAASERLYVQVYGLTLDEEGTGAWLYDFDVAGRRNLGSPRLARTVLPPPCPPILESSKDARSASRPK